MSLEIWKCRALIWNFAIYDLKIRYRNSILGFLWTILEPLLMLGVLYVIFTSIFPSKIEHFGLYLLLGIILWNNFSRGTESSLNSITSRSSIVKQIYFPREVLPISSSISSLIMLMLELVVLAAFMIVLEFIPPITIIWLPLILILEFFLILGLSFPLSILNIRYKDIQFIWKIVVQVGFFATPIIYKLEMLPTELQSILKFSPMVQVVDISHDLALFNKLPSEESIIIGISSTLIILFLGYLIFRKLQRGIVEEL